MGSYRRGRVVLNGKNVLKGFELVGKPLTGNKFVFDVIMIKLHSSLSLNNNRDTTLHNELLFRIIGRVLIKGLFNIVDKIITINLIDKVIINNTEKDKPEKYVYVHYVIL
jgi:hypothetical protein